MDVVPHCPNHWRPFYCADCGGAAHLWDMLVYLPLVTADCDAPIP